MTFARLPYSLFSLVVVAVAGAGCIDLLEVSCTSDEQCASGVCSSGVCTEALDGGDVDESDSHDADDDTLDVPSDPDAADTRDAATDTGLDANDSGDTDVDGGDVSDAGCETTNSCGGCSALPSEPGDACGPCDLDQWRCEGTEGVTCSGATECGDTSFDIVSVTSTSQTSLAATGEIIVLGETLPTGHGFCAGLSATPALGVEGSTCIPLGAVDLAGSFDAEIDGLEAGTRYFVRAFVVTLDATRYSRAIEAWTLPDVPTPVTATRGTLDAQVLVSWPEVVGAAGYRVFRDGDLVAETDEGYFVDEIDVSTLLPTSDGLEPVASQGTREDGVEVTWSVPFVPAPAEATYSVVAFNPGGNSAASAGATGSAAAVPVTGYQIHVNGVWIDVDEQRYFDDTAPFGHFEPRGVSASDGTSAEFVSLASSGLDEVAAEPRSYEVRAVNSQGVGPALSVTGYRDNAAPALEWQWSETLDGAFVALADGSGQTATDRDAPDNGAPRFYRLCVTMPSVDVVCSTPDSGYRAVGVPTITTTGPLDAGADTARFEAVVDNDVTVAVAAIGLTWSTVPDPDPLTGASFVTEADVTTPYTYGAEIGPIDAGSTIYVRAFVDFGEPAIRYFGENIAFTAVAAPPLNVRASDGTSTRAVSITWDASAGATEYEVFRGETSLGTTSSRFFEDTAAPASLPPNGEVLAPSATQGVLADQVRVTWTAPTVTGTVQRASYSVRAISERGSSERSGSDEGWRAPGAIVRYEVEVNGTHVVGAAETRLSDPDADPPTVSWRSFSASDESSAFYIDLDGVAVPAAGDPSSYRVRVVTLDGTGSYSSAVTGWRGVGDVTVWLEREVAAIGDGPDSWEEIGQLTSLRPFRYFGTNDDGTGLFRGAATVGGAGPYYSETDAGGVAKRLAIEQIVAGLAHFCALFEDGSVRCWGNNTYGQLGYGDTQDRGGDVMAMPTRPLDLGAGATMLAAGNDHTCALLDDGSVVCWGRGLYGRLGSQSSSNIGDEADEMPPAAIDLGGRASAVFAGAQNTCAVVDGRLGCWGYNENGQLGYGSLAANTSIGDERGEMPPPFEVVSGEVEGMVLGATHMCALFDGSEDQVWCWGSATNGAIGPIPEIIIGNPYQPRAVILAGATDLLTLTGGFNFNCVLDEDGDVGCWGGNESGQLGIGSTANWGDGLTENIPARNSAVDSATGLVAGRQHACAIAERGLVVCWGNNVAGQLGIGSDENIGDQIIELPAGASAISVVARLVASSAGSTCIVTVDDEVYCWGSNGSGQLANGHAGALGDDPREMPPGLSLIQ